MFDIFHTLLQFVEGNCFFSRRCAVNARQHATENIKTTNERPALKHVASSLGSKMAVNMAGDPWTPEKEEALVAIWKLSPTFLIHLALTIVSSKNEILASTKT